MDNERDVLIRSIEYRRDIFLSQLPEIREAARKLGYAIGLHGSLARDFDLIAAPWTDEAASDWELAQAIKKITGCVRWRVLPTDGHKKPHGRRVYCFDWDHDNYDNSNYIDLSVLPRHDSIFDLIQHIHRQIAFSLNAFGPGARTEGVIDHIRKELKEVEAAPHDLEEWIDLVLLSLDGAWRSGHTPEEIVAALTAKLAKNEARTWPDWRTAEPGKAIEHVRDEQ